MKPLVTLTALAITAAICYLVYFTAAQFIQHGGSPWAWTAGGTVVVALLLTRFVGPQRLGEVEYLVHQILDREYSSWGEGALSPIQVNALHREWEHLRQRIYSAAIIYGASQTEAAQMAELVHTAINHTNSNHSNATNDLKHSNAWKFYVNHIPPHVRERIERRAGVNSGITTALIAVLVGAVAGMALFVQTVDHSPWLGAAAGCVVGLLVGLTNLYAKATVQTKDGNG